MGKRERGTGLVYLVLSEIFARNARMSALLLCGNQSINKSLVLLRAEQRIKQN
jgi:hypothetical protein